VSSYPPQPTFATLLRSFGLDPGLPFADLLPEDFVEDVAEQEGVHFAAGADDVYTPAVTLWAWLAQCLSASKSCVAAVARVLVLRIALDLPPCSAATGAYGKARAKLPERFLQRLTLEVGQAVEDHAPDAWRWRARRVLLADGLTVSLPDTPENQAAYPQPASQKPGLGFPLMRLVVLLTFATASLVGAALGPCQGKETGEPALFRSLLGHLRRGDVVVADRYYCSYWLVALLVAAGVDVAFRLHQRRQYDFRRGQRLGQGDHVVSWAKPARPAWLDEATYAGLPATLTVREVRVLIASPGSRSRQVVVATSLTDAADYTKEDIAELYHWRWHVELDVRSIKQTLKMDILSCKSPEMARKEVWLHLLAYNLVRQALAQAARTGQVRPRQLSFAGGVQTLNAFRWLLLLGAGERTASLLRALLAALGTHQVGDRPGRYEPRKVKRRPKAYGRLTRPRQQEREALRGAQG
jgi:Transposase DDE domain